MQSGEDMECVEIQRKITAFLENELDERDTEEFVVHIMNCASCREELAIQYLITEGMRHLEDGSAFDLNRELREKLDSTLKSIKRKKLFNKIMISLEIASVCVTAVLSAFVLY